MSDAEQAYKAAEAQIVKAKMASLDGLYLTGRPFGHLKRLPLAIAELTDLRTLDLSGTRITDLTPLAGLTALQALDLHDTKVADIAPLAGFPALQILNLRDTQVTDIAPLAGLPALQWLQLNGTQVADVALLAGLLKLKALHLSNTRVADIAPFTELSALQTLDLEGTKVADIAPLARLSALRSLYLSRTQVADIRPLARLSALITLGLQDTRVEDIAPLRGLAALEELGLGNTKVSDISPISELSALKKLGLEGLKVTNIDALAGLESLRYIDLDNTLISDLRPVSNISALIEHVREGRNGLYFQNTPVTWMDPNGLGALAEINDNEERTYKTITYLKALTHWPPGAPPAPEAPPPPPPDRAHVFLSYSRKDAGITATLRAALEADGVEVWQDLDMRYGDQFREVIAERIDGAERVVTLWSAASAASKFVIWEAQRALDSEKLIEIRLDGGALPAPFGSTGNVGDLSGWGGDRDDPRYRRLLWSLRPEVTPGSGVGVRENDDGTLTPEQQPVASPLRNANEVARGRELRAQAARAADLIEEAAHTNCHPRLVPRLEKYAATLGDRDLLWTMLDDKFALAAPLLAEEGGDGPGA